MKLECRQFWTVSLSPKLTARKGHMGGCWYPDGPHTFPYGGFSKVVLILQSEASRRLSRFHISGPGDLLNTEAWGLELAERKIHETSPPAQTSCGHRGSLLVFPVYITHTTWIYFGLHRAKVHLFKWRKQFLNPTNGKQAILWVIISNKPQYPGNSGRLERNWWDPVCLLLWVTGHSPMPSSCHSSQTHFHPFLWGLCHPFPPIQATKIIKMNYLNTVFPYECPKVNL